MFLRINPFKKLLLHKTLGMTLALVLCVCAAWSPGPAFADDRSTENMACANLLQAYDNARIYTGLYSGFQPFDFIKNPITMGEEIEAFIPMTLEPKSHRILPEVNLQRGDQARIFVAEEASRFLRSYLKESAGEEFLDEEFGNIQSRLKYQAEPIKDSFWQHASFGLFSMSDEAYDKIAIKTLRIVQESSLDEMPGWTGVEIVSPIRKNPRDFEIFDALIEHLEVTAELKAWPEYRAGFHIHVGTPKLKPEEAALMLLAFGKIEMELKQRVGIHKSRETYARAIPVAKIENYLRPRYPKRGPTLDDLLTQVAARDRSLNIYSLESYGTVEFRLFDTTLDKGKRQWYREFTRRFVQAIRSQEPALRELLVRYQNEDTIPLSEMLNALDLP